jgi:hypothetical protein
MKPFVFSLFLLFSTFSYSQALPVSPYVLGGSSAQLGAQVVVQDVSGGALSTLLDFGAAANSSTFAAASWSALGSFAAAATVAALTYVGLDIQHEFDIARASTKYQWVEDTEGVDWANQSCLSFLYSFQQYPPNVQFMASRPGYSLDYRCSRVRVDGSSTYSYLNSGLMRGVTYIYPQYMEYNSGVWNNGLPNNSMVQNPAYSAPSLPSRLNPGGQSNIIGNWGQYTIGDMHPSDGKLRWVPGQKGWVFDYLDLDWRGRSLPASDPAGQSVKFVQGTATQQAVTTFSWSGTQASVVQDDIAIDPQTNQQTTTEKQFAVSPQGNVTYNISNTYLNSEPVNSGGSSSATPLNVTVNTPPVQVNFPDDYVKATDLFSPSGYLSQTELNTRKIADALDPSGVAPVDPSADLSDFSSVFFGGTFDGILSFRPNLAGTCTPFHFDLTVVGMGSFSTSAHCELLAPIEGTISAIGIVFWTVTALFIALGA